jgi:hypothetical protein
MKKKKTDFEQWVFDTIDFVKTAVPDASYKKQRDAANDIIKKFKFLFDKKGKRIKNESS